MAEETVLKILCGSNGAMDYERLLDISYGLTEIFRDSSLDKIVENSELFTVIQHNERKEVFAQTRVKLCKVNECNEVCNDIHLCKYLLMTGYCNRRRCSFGHELVSQHNIRVLSANHMMCLSREELCVILLQCDSNLLPPVCVSYNKGFGPYGNCPEKESCTRLHMCMSFIRGRCHETGCCRSHDFHEPHPMGVLKRRGLSSQLMRLIPFIYRNLLTLKSYSNTKNTRPALNNRVNTHNTRCESPETHAEENKICLSFVRGYCNSDKCSRIHCKTPYKWQVKVCGTWTDLPNSEHIERDYCDPSNIHSSGNDPVCFEEMIMGFDEVRRISTESSVLRPSFVLTTSWAWYWKDECNHWIQYASIKEMHRLSSVSSVDLEEKYQEYLRQNDPAVVKFRVGSRFYELNFKDMKQRNEVSGTERLVRRRPVFVSSVDINTARNCEKHTNARLHFSKGVPGFWDQTAIPDSGFQRVHLPPSHRDYRRVQDLFNESLGSFTIRQIERVQNRELWENFMMKKEEMRKANNEKFGERLLFHGTKSSLVDAVCHRNVDFEVSRAAVYGQGIYFSKDAQYSHENTSGCGVRMMFVCRVLLGFYTRGKASFRCPPTKDAKGNLYDSCVNDPHHPSVFVVFDRSQVYPEFLVTYEEKNVFEAAPVVQSSPNAHVVSVTTCIAQVNVKETSQTLEVTDFKQNSVNLHTTATAGSAPDPELTASSPSSFRETNPLITVLSSTSHTAQGFSTLVPASEAPKTLNQASMTQKSDDTPVIKPLQSGVQPRPVVPLRNVEVLRLSETPDVQHYSGNVQKATLTPSALESPSGSVSQKSMIFEELGSESTDALNTVVKYSTKTGDLDMSSYPVPSPPVELNRPSVSHDALVSPAQNVSHCSESLQVSISSTASSHQSVHPHYHPENNSNRDRNAENSPRNASKTPAQEKRCVIQ